MKIPRALSVCTAALALAFAGGALQGCGGPPPATANIKAGNMPDGEAWAGVYYNQVFGYLHVVEQENNFVGRWKRTDGSKWGQMSGTISGNVVHYTWKEHTYGVVGPSGLRQGKGYFVYAMGANNIPEIHGEYGNGDDETGADWNCIKQKGMKPDLDSIKGEVGGTDVPAA